MKVEVMALCDAAADYYGKLNLLGAFDCIWVKQTPAVHSQCAVAVRLRFSQIEEGAHEIKINVVDADGRLVMPTMQGAITITMPPDTDSAVANLILNIHGLKLEKLGPYSIDMAVDGRQEASLPLYVKLMQQKGHGAPPPSPTANPPATPGAVT